MDEITLILQQITTGFMLGSIYVTVAVAFTLTIGILNFLNFTIPLKNLAHVGGHSLIELVSIVLNDIECVDRAIVSTDHPEIKRVALDCGLSVPFMRPEDISGDFISDVEVLKHSL